MYGYVDKRSILFSKARGHTQSFNRVYIRSGLQSESSSSPRGQPQGQDGGELSVYRISDVIMTQVHLRPCTDSDYVPSLLLYPLSCITD